MYSSNSNLNNPIFCIGQTNPQKPCLNDGEISPNSKQEDRLSSTYNFSSPCFPREDETIYFQDLEEYLLQQQPMTAENNNTTGEAIVPEAKDKDVDDAQIGNCKIKKHHSSSIMTSSDHQIPRKRSSKKDRHSKIETAKGPRDRRIRLSLYVAPRFFGLQELLGFDTGSRTVEWLMEQSKSAIKEVARGHHPLKYSSSFGSASSTSECEVISGIIDSAENGSHKEMIKTSKVKPSSNSNKEKKVRASRKAAFHSLTKETREKARERARERTKEKRRFCESQQCCEPMNHELGRSGSWNSFGNEKESGAGGQSQQVNPSFEVLVDVEEQNSFRRQILGTTEGITCDSSMISGNWSSFAIFNYQQNTGVLQEHQLADFQFYGKTWED